MLPAQKNLLASCRRRGQQQHLHGSKRHLLARLQGGHAHGPVGRRVGRQRHHACTASGGTTVPATYPAAAQPSEQVGASTVLQGGGVFAAVEGCVCTSLNPCITCASAACRYYSAFHYYRWWLKEDRPPTADDFHEVAVKEVKQWTECVAARGVDDCLRHFQPQQLIKGMYAKWLPVSVISMAAAALAHVGLATACHQQQPVIRLVSSCPSGRPFAFQVLSHRCNKCHAVKYVITACHVSVGGACFCRTGYGTGPGSSC